MAVDLLIITGDSSVELLEDPSRVAKDVRAINHSMYEFHGFMGMRVLGPYKAAWAVRQHGYSCQVISKIQMISVDELIALCEPYVDKNTLIGIGTTLVSYVFSNRSPQSFVEKLSPQSVVYKFIKCIEHFKNKYNSKVVIGGSQATAFKDIIKHDYLIQGEAENKLPQLMDRIKRSGIQKKPYAWKITGCNFRWHPSDMIVNKEPVPIETSRGCIFRCRFCQFDNIGKKVGTFERPLECVKEEIIDNYSRYGTTHYWLMDDTFNDNNERVNAFCDMVDSLPFQIKFMGYLRLDLAHRFQSTTKRLYKSGLAGCSFGIESFYPEAARAVGKAFNAKQGKDFLEYFYNDICESNISINCCNIIGLPGETEKHIEQTMQWYKERPYIHTAWSSLMIFDPKRLPPGQATSVFEREAIKYGYKFFDDKPSNYWERLDLSSVKAKQIHEKVIRAMKPHNIKAGEPWLSMHYLSILNLSPKEARKIGWQEIYLNKTDIVKANNSRYFDMLRNNIAG